MSEIPIPAPRTSRRRLIAGLAGAGMLARPALAQAYPVRPIRLIVGFGAGGISDLIARIVAESAGSVLGQPVVVENRTGAGGNIAFEAAARAAPDGYTLLVAGVSTLTVNPVLIPTSSFDAGRDLVTIGPLATTPHVLVVRPGLAADLSAFIARARAADGDMTWSTAGVGTSPHQTMLLTQSLADLRFTPVHYRSGAAGVQAVLTGEVQVTAEATAVVAEHIRAGTLRALAAAAPARLALLPDTPTAAEAAGLPGLTNGSTIGLAAPRGIPDAIRDRLAAAFREALERPALLERLAQQGTLPLRGDAASFDAHVEEERARWRPLLVGLSAN
ncbi:tripartite tricarboxylate transporter substrate binding protein [Roseomonas hellenica]|uniref:Tripartite tricarboxylate transporter substrate binding protein n=1 Tax=Plastoroseomonas hellenica TaxID=2687306 RepID=A0ABS5F1G9_9PROT|nr:tripartite tricarboxylate transporter substrate binding protein [Plastoroseomonas hellenica]MBR0666423.1 tripartite tricarboxylate transporter substrate binding protein [Plastoroseomonas hellenica]